MGKVKIPEIRKIIVDSDQTHVAGRPRCKRMEWRAALVTGHGKPAFLGIYGDLREMCHAGRRCNMPAVFLQKMHANKCRRCAH